MINQQQNLELQLATPLDICSWCTPSCPRTWAPNTAAARTMAGVRVPEADKAIRQLKVPQARPLRL